MKQLLALVLVLLVLAGCGSAARQGEPTSPALATTSAPATDVTTAPEATPLPPTASPTLDPTIERPDTPAPPAAPIPSATPAPSGFTPAGQLLEEFNDGLVLAADDGSLIIYYPGSGQVETLLGAGLYRLDGEAGMVVIGWPPRFSPDGRYVLVPRPGNDTWLVERPDGDNLAQMPVMRQVADQRLWATWSPDSRHIVYAATDPAMQNFGGGQLYVQDVAGGGEPRLLTTLPGDAFWAIWSPGCAEPDTGGDCGRSIAALTGAEGVLTIWLVDSETGEARELGRFRPPAVDLTTWLRWANDGSGLIARADRNDVFFPLDGSAPRPVIMEQHRAPSYSYYAPVGGLFARANFTNQSYWELFVGHSGTGDVVALPERYDMIEVQGWTGDGRYLVASLRTGTEVGYYAVDVSGWPEVGEPVVLTNEGLLIGLESALMGQSTEVEPRPWATTEPLAGVGPVATWTRDVWQDPELAVAFPAGWRFHPLLQNQAILTNYAATSDGPVALSDDQFRADLEWSYPVVEVEPTYSEELMRGMVNDADIEAIEVGGVTGARLTDSLTPVCETLVFPHETAEHQGGMLWLRYCPATEQWRAFMLDFVGQMFE